MVRLKRAWAGGGIYDSPDGRFHIYFDEGRWYLTDHAWDPHPCENFHTLGEARNYIVETLARPNEGQPERR